MKNIVRTLRRQMGWTQEQLGERLGVSRQAIIAIENGRFDPALPLALRIGRLFEQPVERIFELDA